MGKHDDDGEAILRRRNKFVALALSGLTAGAMGCSDPDPGPVPCLDAPLIDAGEGMDSSAGLDADTPDDGAVPLDAVPRDALPEDAAGRDAAPTACLSIALPRDGGEVDSGA